jgi:DNA-binding HxlR family transcriptional regulator
VTAEYDPCPISRTVSLVAGRWTTLILRELFYGRSRFEEFQTALGVSRATLSERLRRLEADGLVERVQYTDRPPRYEYRLADKGRALWPVLATMWAYGSEWLFDEPTPLMMIDVSSGTEIAPELVDSVNGESIDVSRVQVVRRR